MADRRKAEDSAVFLLNKLNDFRSAANNLTAEEEKVVDDIRSALTDLTEVAKQHDSVQPDFCLSSELHLLTIEIFQCFDRYTAALQSPELHPGGSFARHRPRSFLEVLTKVQGISKKFGERLDALKKKEEGSAPNIYEKLSEVLSATRSLTKRHYETGGGSSVSKSPLGDAVLVQRGDLVRFSGHKERLIQLLLEDISGRKDVLKPKRGRVGKTTLGTSNIQWIPSKLWNPLNLKFLKVLNLTGMPLQIAPDGLFELTLLRYLSLRSTSIKEIPGSIGKLTHLEFLDLKHSLVTELPKEVEGLERICHILIYHHEKDPLMESYDLIGFKASCRVGGFKCLEKLCFVESDNSTLEDLGNLTELRRLGITKLRAGQSKLLCSSLDKLKWLNSLNVHALDEDEIIDLHYLSSPPEYLEHLYLHGRLEKLPMWISSLQCLTKIILRWSQLEEDLLATLGELPNLVELELRRAYEGKQLDFKDGQFPELKILLLDELEGLRSMSLEKGTMPRLENLTISRCQWLEKFPFGIEHIPSIRKLTFFDMSHEFYEMVQADHEKDDYRYFERIPEVYFTQWRTSRWETHPPVQTKDIKASQVNTEGHLARVSECSYKCRIKNVA